MPVTAMTPWERGIGDDASGVKQTFSSWDNCMSKAYCKWPVIIVIIIASLVVLSIITCLVRCMCCGLECCCGCFSCCNACCPSPRGKREKPSKYADAPPYGGYQPGGYGGPSVGPGRGYESHPPPSYGPPSNTFNQPAQFATFETGKKSKTGGNPHEDALPAMPSWENASTRKVEDDSHPEEVELDHMNHADESRAPMLAHQAPSPMAQGGGFGAAAASAPYQDRAATNGGDLGNPYAHDNYGESQELYGSAVGMHQQPYGSQHSPYGQAASPNQQHYDGTAYGVVGQNRSPPPPASPYGRAELPHQQSYESHTSYGVAPAHSPVSPPPQAFSSASPQQRYGAASPPAHGGGVPASLMPARGNTPQAPQQQQGYQSYSPYSQPEQSSYTAYAPQQQGSRDLPMQRKPAPQNPNAWRDM